MQKWTVGAPCRAIYSADGKIYEAIISKIHQNSGMCTVKFVGNYFIFIYYSNVLVLEFQY